MLPFLPPSLTSYCSEQADFSAQHFGFALRPEQVARFVLGDGGKLRAVRDAFCPCFVGRHVAVAAELPVEGHRQTAMRPGVKFGDLGRAKLDEFVKRQQRLALARQGAVAPGQLVDLLLGLCVHAGADVGRRLFRRTYPFRLWVRSMMPRAWEL